MTSGAYNRKKGHDFERLICKELKIFFPNAKTARSSARMEDAQGIDIINCDFNVQTKAREHLNVFDVLYEEMPQGGKINVLFWKKNRQKDIVAMSKEDFYKLLRLLSLLS